MTDEIFLEMCSNFNLSEFDLNELLENKDNHSIFMIYVISQDYKYNSEYPFKKLGYSMFTKLKNPMHGYDNLFDILLYNNIIDTNIKDLFNFNTRILARDIINTGNLI